jgi:non-ribosomal peptide synthase protein (TIGR01720 family)
VDLEGHGREDLFRDVDLSRTVGWFTTVFPVHLNLKDAWGPGEALKAVKEQLRGVPRRGIGYGLLRYLRKDEEMVKRLRALTQAEVGFNYLGQLDQVLGEASPFGLARESAGPSFSPQGWRSHLLDVNGAIVGGRLLVEWSYSEAIHRQETVEQVAGAFIEALRAIVAHCRSPEAVGYTPSDFRDAGLSQEAIEAVVEEVGGTL